MRLVDLEPQFWKVIDERQSQIVDTVDEADGVFFVCPKCLKDNGGVRPGVHGILCWRPRVPLTISPGPGRWEFEGAGFQDLTLRAGSSSILLTGPGCQAHFFITKGEIVGL